MVDDISQPLYRLAHPICPTIWAILYAVQYKALSSDEGVSKFRICIFVAYNKLKGHKKYTFGITTPNKSCILIHHS